MVDDSLYFLLILLLPGGLSVAATVNYHVSVLKKNEALRLQQEATQTLLRAQQEYSLAVAARTEAKRANDEAHKEPKHALTYWDVSRLN